jgi:hypothetical protein
MAMHKSHKDMALIVGSGVALGGLLLWLFERNASAATPPPAVPPAPTPPSTTPTGTVTVGPITYNTPPASTINSTPSGTVTVGPITYPSDSNTTPADDSNIPDPTAA